MDESLKGSCNSCHEASKAQRKDLKILKYSVKTLSLGAFGAKI
jgi:hypothetical protein